MSECLGEIIEQQAGMNPEQVAIISPDGQMSYRELVAHVNSIAERLIGLGVRQETRVAVCAERSLAWVVGTLAVLRAGGVYIPIDPMLPCARKSQIIRDAGAQWLLVQPNLSVNTPKSVKTVDLTLEKLSAEAKKLKLGTREDQAAYGIYTSGSRGSPKNVIVSHGSLCNYARVLRHHLVLSASDRYLHTASMAFSASIRQIVAPLVSGATVVVATQEEVRDPSRLIARMVHVGVTVLDSVPSYLSKWLAVARNSPRDRRDGLAASLRFVLSTGEPLPGAVVKAFHTEFPKCRILNLYGQTETAGTVAIHDVTSIASGPVPIGRPLSSSEFKVLDEQLGPASSGELFVSGQCVARGYDGSPKLTAASFLPDPSSDIPGTRMYRTGDRVESLEDGLLLFKARIDSQVKVHGIRVELDEIDLALMTHPEIMEAATVLRSSGDDGSELTAFVVPCSQDSVCKAEDLREMLLATLPEAMVPRRIIVVAELPRTPSGKIDRPALTIKEVLPLGRQRSSIAPITKTENLVAECWETTLQLGEVGTEDDFFDLGGDSIQAILMLMQLQSLLPVQLPLGTLFFQDPTLGRFANAIDVELDRMAICRIGD
jgi:amino acid adenylation domain-containing protein